ncbi:MipA/OmpV family protein [Loktanella salsilacus]|uniref:MipA/OmpV family protein n=1 Tax=Loktanella salsilacus TaxID=195913 RepID=UPI00373649DF
MSSSRLLSAALFTALLPVAAAAQNTLSIGLGPQSAPAYFGSSENEANVTGNFSIQQLSFGPLRFGGSEGGTAQGFGFAASIRYIGERSGAEYSELAGTETIDAALELGGGLTYTAENFYVFAVVRKGATGHDAVVGEIGADAIYRPSAPVELRVGPRFFFGDDEYAQQYFGVTAAEAGNGNTLTAYDAKGGLLSQGVEASASYAFSEDWGVTGTVRYEEYANDAVDSPIVEQGSDNATTASLVVTRRFSF